MFKFFSGVAVGAALVGYAWWYKKVLGDFDDQEV